MTNKGLNPLMDVLPNVFICPLRKNSAPFLPEGKVTCTHLAPQQIHRGNRLK